MYDYIFSLILIILIVVFDIFALYCIKMSKKSDFFRYITMVIILYIGIISCLYLLDHDLITGSHLNILRSMLSLCFAIILGTILFEYNFNKYSIVAIIFALLAILFSYISLKVSANI
jgi:hypothetical protein